MSEFASDLSFSSMHPMKHYKIKGGADGSNGAIIAIVVVIIVILLTAIILAACWSGCGTETIYVTGADGKQTRMKVSKKALRDMPLDSRRPNGTTKHTSTKTHELGSEAEARALLSGSRPSMVFVHMNGCGFCDKAKEYYNDSLAAEHPYVTLAMIDAGKCQQLCREKGITGFPTFLTNFGSGVHVGYKQKAAMDQILQGARKGGASRMSVGGGGGGGVVHELVDADKARDALQQKQKTVLFLYAPWCGFCKKQKPVLDELAAKHTDVKFIAINAEQAGKPITEAMKIDGFPTFLSNFGPGAQGKPRVVVGYKDGAAFEQAILKA